MLPDMGMMMTKGSFQETDIRLPDMGMMMTKGSFQETDIRNVWNIWQKISPSSME